MNPLVCVVRARQPADFHGDVAVGLKEALDDLLDQHPAHTVSAMASPWPGVVLVVLVSKFSAAR